MTILQVFHNHFKTNHNHFRFIHELFIGLTILNISIINLLPATAYAAVERLAGPVAETPLKIKALNPGYTEDGVANVGEFIELIKISDDPLLSLTGFTLRYTNSSGKISNLFEFPEGSQMAGETILLRLASSPNSDQADLTYTKTLAMEAGPLELVYLDTVVDSVCWRGKTCLSKFSKDAPTSIVQNLSTGEFSHQAGYSPAYDSAQKNYLLKSQDEAVDAVDNSDAATSSPQCRGLIFNELLSYYETDKSEQFIEFLNPTDEPILLDGCSLRYKKKLYPLSGMVDASSFYLRDTSDFTLTKNPSSSNLLELIDVTDQVVDSLEYTHGQKKSTSYALFGYDETGKPKWLQTYAPTPGSENTLQEFRSCPAGKVINEATGNCVKASTVNKTSAECPAGKYRNPETGRCKKYETKTTTECKEGYERNPETGRCRKIKNNSAADYALVPETGGEKQVFVAGFAIAALVLLALAYLAFQFRHELKTLFLKLRPRKKKDEHP